MLTPIQPHDIIWMWNLIPQIGGEKKMTDTKKLRERISSAGLKLKFVAQTLGITPYALQMKIDNDREFKVSEVDALAVLLNLTLLEKDEIFFAK